MLLLLTMWGELSGIFSNNIMLLLIACLEVVLVGIHGNAACQFCLRSHSIPAFEQDGISWDRYAMEYGLMAAEREKRKCITTLRPGSNQLHKEFVSPLCAEAIPDDELGDPTNPARSICGLGSKQNFGHATKIGPGTCWFFWPKTRKTRADLGRKSSPVVGSGWLRAEGKNTGFFFDPTQPTIRSSWSYCGSCLTKIMVSWLP